MLDYCCRNKIIDEGLLAKWRKPGYEKLCATFVINTRNYNFGTVSICRVPASSLGDDAVVECPTTGCRGCASGGARNIFGTKYGQYLAKIQVAREEKAAREDAAADGKRGRESDGGDGDGDGDDDGDAPRLEDAPAPDEEEVVGRSKATIWADIDDARAYDDDANANKRPRGPLD